MKKITSNFLTRHHACDERKKLFREVFGRECDVSIESAIKWYEALKKQHNTHYFKGDLMWLVYEVIGMNSFTLNKLGKLVDHVVGANSFQMHGLRIGGSDSVISRLWDYNKKRLMEAVVQIARAG